MITTMNSDVRNIYSFNSSCQDHRYATKLQCIDDWPNLGWGSISTSP